MTRLWLALAAVYGFLGVVLGAFGAHALKARLDAELLAVWRTGVEYHFYHALALLAVGVLAAQRPSRMVTAACACFALGIPTFSGSLYAVALGAPRGLGVVTPVGGLLFLAGWALLAIWALRSA